MPSFQRRAFFSALKHWGSDPQHSGMSTLNQTTVLRDEILYSTGLK